MVVVRVVVSSMTPSQSIDHKEDSLCCQSLCLVCHRSPQMPAMRSLDVALWRAANRLGQSGDDDADLILQKARRSSSFPRFPRKRLVKRKDDANQICHAAVAATIGLAVCTHRGWWLASNRSPNLALQTNRLCCPPPIPAPSFGSLDPGG